MTTRRLLLIPAMRCNRCGDDHCALPDAAGLCWRCAAHKAANLARSREASAARWDRWAERRLDRLLAEIE